MTAARRIKAAGTAARIAFLTVSEDDRHVAEAVGIGATGYILKGVSADRLRQILRGVSRGEAHFSPAVARHVLEIMRPGAQAEKRPIDELTRREE
ncbi:transcriptional regulator [Jhaorihella thermophila]|uniref:Response regulator receiver domain-containing protein n=1 Tax=Jhaorihella thermophila TaxID=488547 RepID=A0A1H5YLM6_9RHOB|nr:response regulator transcription factor [Jhaorihella thermophila]SEG24978.1 Response regulator receiver domain-containing protein [Jhaorihella thermophila]